MLNRLFILLIGLLPIIGYSQSTDSTKSEFEIFTLVEKMPEFPGGIKKMMKFLKKNVEYPQEARNKGITGKVIVNFTIAGDGAITDVKIAQSVHELLDAEAMRVVKSMPKWTPAIQKGKPVKCLFNLPINFNL